MRLKSLALKNIRSYSSLQVDFKEGSTMLSGDIGSGKTTILLSIEFALFGLMKGMLTGSALLRHDAKEGNVTLSFTSDNNDIVISRTLKRNANSIVQDSGYIQINNQKEECTAIELKSKIISILGYSDDAITKSKSLIFRYTVYTPQEDMKQIILDSEDERLEKLTKIFNIDKYKRIRENSENYAKELRLETKIMKDIEEDIFSLDSKQKQYEIELEDNGLKLQTIEVQLTQKDLEIKIAENKLKDIDETLKKSNSLNHEMNILQVEIKNRKRHIDLASREIIALNEQKDKISKEILVDEIKKTRTSSEVVQDITNYKDKFEDTQKILIDSKSKLGIIERKKQESDEIKKNISNLDNCPTCMQQVGLSHKEHIENEENKKISALKEKEIKFAELITKAQNNLIIINKKIDALQVELLEIRGQEQKIIYRKKQELVIKEIIQKIDEKNKQKLELEQKNKEDIQKENILKIKINDLILDDKIVKSLNDDIKKSKDDFMKLKIMQGQSIQKIKDLTKNLEENEVTREKKNQALIIVKRKKTIEHWLTNHFVNLIDVIEKNVMASIRLEFKSYFEEWFNMLVEDESLSVTIDERFSPKITQNGYDTNIENLSGGEKTAVALAYRLALNKVINSMISTIKTKDLIILDEPTDGFSSHQLDKVRDVLDALGCKQTIIVSHESKMESFVNHIIKIRKQEHESQIL